MFFFTRNDSTSSLSVSSRASFDTDGGGIILTGKIFECLLSKMVFVTNIIS